MLKLYKPIIENEKFNFKNFYSFIIANLKQLIKYCIYLYIFYFLSFFLGAKNYTSSVSFYTNYASNPSLGGFSTISLPLSLTESQLRFDVGNYINSDKFLTEICNQEYEINGTVTTLSDKWGGKYNKYKQFMLPHNFFLMWSSNLMFTDIASHESKKLYFAKKLLRAKMTYSEDRKSDLKTITISLLHDPSLPKQILDEMVKSIVNYSNEISNLKSSEKISFLEQRTSEVKSDLLIAENNLLNFLEKNIKINSPSLRIEKDRLERDVTLLSQILYQVSLQVESEKVELSDQSSSVFLLDEAQVPPRKSGLSLAKGLFFYTIALSFFFYGYKFFVNRNLLIK